MKKPTIGDVSSIKAGKALGDKRGYACRHDEKGVYVRPEFHGHVPDDQQVLVPWDDVKTITWQDSKLYDFAVAMM